MPKNWGARRILKAFCELRHTGALNRRRGAADDGGPEDGAREQGPGRAHCVIQMRRGFFSHPSNADFGPRCGSGYYALGATRWHTRRRSGTRDGQMQRRRGRAWNLAVSRRLHGCGRSESGRRSLKPRTDWPPARPRRRNRARARRSTMASSRWASGRDWRNRGRRCRSRGLGNPRTAIGSVT